MSYNGSGSFAINTAGQPVAAGTTIDDVAFNALTADLATGLTTAICKDGQTTITADIPFNSHKITGLAAATVRTDAASLATIQDGTGVYIATVAGTADAITLTPAPAIAAYATGQYFTFLAGSANTGAATVAISGLTAKAIKKNGTTALAANDILAGSMVGIRYDGTNFQLISMGQSMVGALTTAQSDISTLQTNSISKTIVDAKGDLIAATGNDAVARVAVGTNGQLLAADSSQSAGVKWVDPASAVSFVGAILNGTITVTMAANAVTIALKTLAGSDPSSSDPVSIVFRNGTATTGNYVIRTITAATSTVISSGSTLGTVSGAISRIYVGALDNAGTVELCVWNPVSTAGLWGFTESELISSTAEGGAGAADSAHVVYSTTARANVYARYLGYFESTQVTAGTWASNASKIQLMGPGVHRTGQIIQRKFSQDGAVATGTNTITVDDSIPQSGEGDQYMLVAITPTSTVNLLEIHHQGWYANTAANGNTFIVSLFQDSTANALVTAARDMWSAVMADAEFTYLMAAGTTSATTFKVRCGCSAAGTTTFNGTASARKFGGVVGSILDVKEICA